MAEAYNASGNVKTLVGNWSEEAVLKEATGTARTRGKAGRLASSETQEPTAQRVIEHTEQLRPSEWQTHSAAAFKAPVIGTDCGMVAYPKTSKAGPRQMQELQQLWQQAQLQAKPAATGLSEGAWETTYKSEFESKSTDGIQVGARVMNQDGTPAIATRDPVFLQETGISPTAGRLMGGTSGSSSGPGLLGYVRGPSRDGRYSGGLTSSSIDPAMPITMYTEAAAKATYGNLYGTGLPGKTGLMNRSDQFSKPMSDVNKQQHLL